MAEQPLSLILKSENLIHENDSHNQYHFLSKTRFVIAFGTLGNQARRAEPTTARRTLEESFSKRDQFGVRLVLE
ncbi:MAG: hypothetical protein VX210_16830 [Myxococcota bacterium]|nr:hypothetical protein [Myxococcota bacterium]